MAGSSPPAIHAVPEIPGLALLPRPRGSTADLLPAGTLAQLARRVA